MADSINFHSNTCNIHAKLHWYCVCVVLPMRNETNRKESNEIKVIEYLDDLVGAGCATIMYEYREQNKWLASSNFEIDRIYQIKTPSDTYTNAIIDCSLDTQKLFINKGVIIFGFEECKTYEHVDLLQCKQCQCFGRIERYCQYSKRCRHCAADQWSPTYCVYQSPKIVKVYQLHYIKQRRHKLQNKSHINGRKV